MPLNLNNVLLKISPAINDQFIGLEATYVELKTNAEKLRFIELCLNVLNDQTFNFDRCSDNPVIQAYFSYIKDCFINPKNRLFAHNLEIRHSDEHNIALFARLVMLKLLARLALQNKNEFPPAFITALIATAKALRSAKLPMMMKHVIFKGQVFTTDAELHEIFKEKVNDERELNYSTYLTIFFMVTSFWLYFLLYAIKSPAVVLDGFIFLTSDNLIDFMKLMALTALNSDDIRDLKKLKAVLNAQPEVSPEDNEKNLEHLIISADDIRNLESLLMPVIEEELTEIVIVRPGLA